MTFSLTWLDVSVAIAGLFIVNKLIKQKATLPLPPGPRKLPLLGNLLDIPSEEPWVTFAKWGKEHGDISSVQVLGQHMIILNAAQPAIDLLDKRSLTYSDRPTLTLACDLIGWNRSLVLSQYGSHFKEIRKNIYRVIGSRGNLEKYHGLIERQSHRFVKRLLATPDSLADHIRWVAGAIVLVISHGYEVQDENDPYLETADTAIHYFSITTSAGAFLVDVLPILRHLPAWFPGATFKKIAKLGSESLTEMTDKPHDVVKAQMAAGTALHSFTSELLEGRELSDDEEEAIKWSAQTLYSGGADTTVSATHSFFLAMTLFPDVQRKAQAEIDAVIGTNRLPTIADRESLPYMNALTLEVLRWFSLAPLGVAHVATEDDVYEGYFIPKGSLVVPNIWQMLHDPRVYAEPMEFKPERFLPSEGEEAETDPHNVCFGFGRRQCPGIVLAETSLFIECALTLAVFNISKATENGRLVTPKVEQTTGTISHPKPFKFSLTPRSAKALELVQQEA
ncbi:cytochrome P450 [Leucogyrophana mollusca]|uniref:Cytochrome P450 n=1 Tax=Leucogyrophana mollusca TaxID=85980 RepID=A0ACB8C0A1_9AGAM|nr:cytochrome P450 [Leucogyrophana mollusca]